MVTCQGVCCKWYQKNYKVQQYQGAYTPVFDRTVEYCLHPKVIDKNRLPGISREVLPGANLISLKECPK